MENIISLLESFVIIIVSSIVFIFIIYLLGVIHCLIFPNDENIFIFIRKHFFPKYHNRKKQEADEIMKKQEYYHKLQSEQIDLLDLKKKIYRVFMVNLDTIDDINTQEEIVRIVNLQCYKTSLACMNQDKEQRGEQVENSGRIVEGTIDVQYHLWNTVVKWEKENWMYKRELAMQIYPKLKERMPHFSQIEPLKSYNENYLLQKK